jgi:hypothetical protein
METEEWAMLLGGGVIAGLIYMRVKREREEPVEADGYGAARLNLSTSVKPDKDTGAEIGTGAKIGGLVLIGGIVLVVPITSSIIFGRKYGGPGYLLGFFVPGAIGAAIGAISRIGREEPVEVEAEELAYGDSDFEFEEEPEQKAELIAPSVAIGVAVVGVLLLTAARQHFDDVALGLR